MKVQTITLITLALYLFATTASALVPADVNVTTDKEWLIAGKSDTSTVKVTVPSICIPCQVKIWCDDPTMGSITSGAHQTAFWNTPIAAIFTAGNKKGKAVIKVSITYPNLTTYQMEYTEASAIQKVDHNIPQYYASIVYEPIVDVQTNTSLTIQLKDSYGNIVDNQRVQGEYAESITFRDAQYGNSGFWDGTSYIHTLTQPIDTNGDATVIYRMPNYPGDNTLSISAPNEVVSPNMWISFRGTSHPPMRDLTHLIGASSLMELKLLLTIPANN